MANKQALRDLQARLAERLQAARSEPVGRSWLAVECGTRGFLLPLREAGEIFPMAPVLAVPHSHRWFLGVANLRGHLNGVVDLAGYLGVKAGHERPALEGSRDQARLVGFNPQLNINCVLMVDRLSGLRAEGELTAEASAAPGPRPAFAGAAFRDAQGRVWQELLLARLAGDESFLRIVG